MTSPIPSYSNPCMARTKDSSTVYLVGSPNNGSSALNVHIINITNISAPVLTRFASSVESESASWENYTAPWKYSAPKMCTTFLGASPAFYDTLFIQQLGPYTSWNTRFQPINGTIPRPTKFTGTAYMSKQAFSFVGQAGDNVWTLALNNRTDTKYPWSFTQWYVSGDAIQNANPKLSVFKPLLTVGTYTLGASAPAKGHFIIFDNLGAGVILPTTSNDIKTAVGARVTFLDPRPVDMSGIKLTADAFYTNMETGAYLLDKAQDGTVSTYYIDPSASDTLQRIPTPQKVPRFSSAMAAATAGSQIVLYSTTDSGPAQIHLLNTKTNEWSGSDLVIPASDPSPTAGISVDQGNTSTNLGAIIGGAVGGMALLAVGVLLYVRRRRHRNSENNSDNCDSSKSDIGNDNIKNSSSNNKATDGKSRIIDDKDIRPTELDARSPEGAPLPGKHPQFPPGAPPRYGQAYGYNYGHEGDLAVPLAGPQVILPNPQRCGSAMYPAQSNAYHDYISPNIDRQPLQAFADGDKPEIDSNASDIVVPDVPSFGDKAEIDSSDDFVPLALNKPPPPPPTIPSRPTGYASYSLVHS